MRALGAYPTEKDLVLKYIPGMKDDDQSDFISYNKFEKTMLEILSTKECDYVIELTLYLVRPKELEAFMQAAKDPTTGNIFYEDYVALLIK